MVQNELKGRRVVYICSALLLLIIAVYFTNTRSHSASNESANVKIEAGEHQTIGLTTKTELASSSKVSQQTVNPLAQQFATVMGPPEDTAKIQNWFTAAGYPLWNNNTDYAGYSDEALNELGKSGDIQALLTLGTRRYQSGYEPAKELFLKAAALGSTAAIERIGSITESTFIEESTPQEEKKAAVKEALSWYNAAALRGDRFPNFISGESLIRVKKVELTDEDRRAIYERSQAIYAELEQKRAELNLGKFDNSVPDVVSRFLDRLEAGGKKLVYP